MLEECFDDYERLRLRARDLQILHQSRKLKNPSKQPKLIQEPLSKLKQYRKNGGGTLLDRWKKKPITQPSRKKNKSKKTGEEKQEWEKYPETQSRTLKRMMTILMKEQKVLLEEKENLHQENEKLKMVESEKKRNHNFERSRKRRQPDVSPYLTKKKRKPKRSASNTKRRQISLLRPQVRLNSKFKNISNQQNRNKKNTSNITNCSRNFSSHVKIPNPEIEPCEQQQQTESVQSTPEPQIYLSERFDWLNQNTKIENGDKFENQSIHIMAPVTPSAESESYAKPAKHRDFPLQQPEQIIQEKQDCINNGDIIELKEKTGWTKHEDGHKDSPKSHPINKAALSKNQNKANWLNEDAIQNFPWKKAGSFEVVPHSKACWAPKDLKKPSEVSAFENDKETQIEMLEVQESTVHRSATSNAPKSIPFSQQHEQIIMYDVCEKSKPLQQSRVLNNQSPKFYQKPRPIGLIEIGLDTDFTKTSNVISDSTIFSEFQTQIPSFPIGQVVSSQENTVIAKSFSKQPRVKIMDQPNLIEISNNNLHKTMQSSLDVTCTLIESPFLSVSTKKITIGEEKLEKHKPQSILKNKVKTQTSPKKINLIENNLIHQIIEATQKEKNAANLISNTKSKKPNKFSSYVDQEFSEDEMDCFILQMQKGLQNKNIFKEDSKEFGTGAVVIEICEQMQEEIHQGLMQLADSIADQIILTELQMSEEKFKELLIASEC